MLFFGLVIFLCGGSEGGGYLGVDVVGEGIDNGGLMWNVGRWILGCVVRE